MKKLGIMAGAGAVVVAAALTAGVALAANPAAGKSCTKVGAKAKAGKANLACTKQGKKLVWVAQKTAASTTAATAAATVSVNLKFEGQAQVKQSGSRLDIKADANGSGTPISSAHLTGEGQGNSEAKPCPVFTGPGTIEGGGDKLSFDVDAKSSGCPDADDNNVVIVTGLANVTGGGGKYAKAKGTLRFAGNFERDSGKLTISFTGNLTT